MNIFWILLPSILIIIGVSCINIKIHTQNFTDLKYWNEKILSNNDSGQIEISEIVGEFDNITLKSLVPINVLQEKVNTNSENKDRKNFRDMLFKSDVSSKINEENNAIEKLENYDPDAYLDTVQLIVKYGYPAEAHTVKTEDGYLLTIHRIPNAKKNYSTSYRQAVFLQHGLLGSSSNFVTSGAENGLAYILSEAGYDVWMGNFRGNTYSRAHVDLSVKDSAFWDFSWDESALYDLPAMIDYVNNHKKTKDLLYVGHSMGTTTLFALLSTRLEYNTRIKAAFALAPVAYTSTVRSPIRFLAPFSHDIEWITEYLGANEFFPQNVIFKWLGNTVCEINHFSKEICLNIMFLLTGYDEKEFNEKILKVVMSHTPAGTSTKTVIHFAQEIKNNGKFQRYDFGSVKNLEVYGQNAPPEYFISNITLPIALFCADNDWLAGMADSKNIYKQLKHPIEYYDIPLKDFNHIDFLWAKDAPTLVYHKLLELLQGAKSLIS